MHYWLFLRFIECFILQASVNPIFFDDNAKVNWEEAKALCPTVGLVMSVVENEAESDALSALSYERLTKGKGKAYFVFISGRKYLAWNQLWVWKHIIVIITEQFIWLGAYLRREDEKWVWEANGEELTFTKWLDGTELQYTSSSAKEPSVNCGYLKASPGWDTWACGPGTGYEFALTVCQEPWSLCVCFLCYWEFSCTPQARTVFNKGIASCALFPRFGVCVCFLHSFQCFISCFNCSLGLSETFPSFIHNSTVHYLSCGELSLAFRMSNWFDGWSGDMGLGPGSRFPKPVTDVDSQQV